MAATRSAIVTGASHGIGAAVAERLAREGLAVTVNFAGNEGAARALVDTIVTRGGRPSRSGPTSAILRPSQRSSTRRNAPSEASTCSSTTPAS